MKSTELAVEFSEPVQIDAVARWDVYHRLQELAIACSCQMGKPLQVSIASPTEAIQLWSVVKQATTSCHERRAWLETCWRAS